MRKITLKYMKIALVIILISALILSSIISSNSYHIDGCHNDNCKICEIIHMAQIISQLAIAIHIYLIASFLVYFFLSRMRSYAFITVQNSLVFQKVQMNA